MYSVCVRVFKVLESVLLLTSDVLYKTCLDFFLQRLSGTFLILRKIQRDVITSVQYAIMELPRCSCQILMKLKFSGHFFLFSKHTHVKFHENPCSGS